MICRACRTAVPVYYCDQIQERANSFANICFESFPSWIFSNTYIQHIHVEINVLTEHIC